jgi:hypothetical protein
MKKAIKIILIIVATIFAILGIFISCWIFITKIKVTNVSEYTNQTNNYTVLFQAVGEPEWPFGRTKVKITLLDDNKKKIESFNCYISDDGAIAREENIDVKWFENYVEVTISGSEQGDNIYKMYFK